MSSCLGDGNDNDQGTVNLIKFLRNDLMPSKCRKFAVREVIPWA